MNRSAWRLIWEIHKNIRTSGAHATMRPTGVLLVFQKARDMRRTKRIKVRTEAIAGPGQ